MIFPLSIVLFCLVHHRDNIPDDKEFKRIKEYSLLDFRDELARDLAVLSEYDNPPVYNPRPQLTNHQSMRLCTCLCMVQTGNVAKCAFWQKRKNLGSVLTVVLLSARSTCIILQVRTVYRPGIAKIFTCRGYMYVFFYFQIVLVMYNIAGYFYNFTAFKLILHKLKIITISGCQSELKIHFIVKVILKLYHWYIICRCIIQICWDMQVFIINTGTIILSKFLHNWLATQNQL